PKIMLQFDYQKLLTLPSEHGLNQTELAFASDEITDLLNKIKQRKQGFADILDDQNLINEIKAFVESKRGSYQYIVVLGIGGSALGTITLQNSLYRHSADCPQLFVMDNIDPDFMAEIETKLVLEKTLFLVVSKSGGTIETLS